MNNLYIALILIMEPMICAAHSDHAQIDRKKNGIETSIIASAYGDALGRITEFIPNTSGIELAYGPKGLTSFQDFKQDDFIKGVAAYTDDTVMSRIVLSACINARIRHQSYAQLLSAIAIDINNLFSQKCFFIDPWYDIRAHGPTNIHGGAHAISRAREILMAPGQPKRLMRDYDLLYNEQVAREGGCGSVMRAWPIGLIFHDDTDLIIKLADEQSQLTHRHPMARAACAAIAVGVRCALHGDSVHEIIESMSWAAEQFDDASKIYKKQVRVPEAQDLSGELVAQDRLLTSDMIRYAYKAALEGKKPQEVLGTDNKKSANHRSPYGYLLGWAADEAVAAAVYIFARHPGDMRSAMIEAVNTPGDSDSIATLVGALVGARVGTSQEIDPDIALLEKYDELKDLARQGYNALLADYELFAARALNLEKKSNMLWPLTICGAVFTGSILFAYHKGWLTHRESDQ